MVEPAIFCINITSGFSVLFILNTNSNYEQLSLGQQILTLQVTGKETWLDIPFFVPSCGILGRVTLLFTHYTHDHIE